MSDRDGGSTQGMTMRQYYKAAALQGLCANPGGPFQANDRPGWGIVTGWGIVNCNFREVANVAAALADAALAEDATFEELGK